MLRAAPAGHRSALRPLPSALAAAGLALLLASLGCGYEEAYTGMGDGAIPGDPLRPKGGTTCTCECKGGGSEDDGRLDVDDLSGLAYRFDELVLSAPLTGQMADMLNGYFATEIAKGSDGALSVLLVIEADDREAGALSARVGAGEGAGDDAYRLPGGSPLELALTEARFRTTSEALLDFPSMVGVLPIKKLRLGGLFSPDAATIGDGELVGVLLTEDAQQIPFGGGSFADLLESLRIPPDHLDEEDQPDGWTFRGTFGAARITLAE